MAEIVSQQLQLDCAPQSSPRPAIYFVYKPMTQLREKRLYRLSHSAHQPLLWPGSLPRQHKHFGLSFHRLARLFSAVGLICRQYPSVCRRSKPDARFPVGYIGRGQHRSDDLPFYVDQHMQLEAEEPSGAGLAEVRPFIPKQPHHPVTNRLTDWYRLGVNSIKREAESVTAASRFDHRSDQITEPVKARDPLLIRAELRESLREVEADEAISLFERGDSESRLHQSDGQYLSVSESRPTVMRRAPACSLRVSFEVVVDEAVDFSHLVKYRSSQKGRPPGVDWFSNPIFTPKGCDGPSFLTQDSR